MKKEYEKIIEYRSLGEIHIYIGISKSDNIFSDNEKHKILYCASKSEIIGGHREIEEEINKRINQDIIAIFNEEKFNNWSATDHLNFAMSLLNKAKDISTWSIDNLFEKIEKSLQSIAELDEYSIKESRFIKKIKSNLLNLENN